MMNYYVSETDSFGYVHSIDMVYVEYFSYLSPGKILDILRDLHIRYPEVKYVEYLNCPYQTKYQFYHDNVSFGGFYIQMGRYNNYDKITKTFDLLNMFQIRVNPNKYMTYPWAKELMSKLLSSASSGYLKKYDYAIDIPLPMKAVQIFDTRKEKGLYKGTRYLGQSGRHGYCKIYDKQKESNLDNVLTRLEYTFIANSKPSLDNVFILTPNSLNKDYTALNDSDRSIVEMYLQIKAMGGNYDLKLGRRKMDKLKEYISGQYVSLDYSNILDNLLQRIRNEFSAFEAANIIADEDNFVQVDNDIDAIWNLWNKGFGIVQETSTQF